MADWIAVAPGKEVVVLPLLFNSLVVSGCGWNAHAQAQPDDSLTLYESHMLQPTQSALGLLRQTGSKVQVKLE